MMRWLGGFLAGAAAAGALILGSGRGVQSEEITMTTYYPSPRGVYDELRVNTLVFRDTKTGTVYSLKMNDKRLILTDMEEEQAYLVVDLEPEL
ncbi:MAG TPA: hypothetical protein VGB20_00620 [bacterium]